MPLGETIVAIGSAPGRAGRGMVRISGAATREILGSLLTGGPRPWERECFAAQLRMASGAELPVLVATYRAPASYTGEDAAEILMPGNPLLLERIVGELAAMAGVRAASPGEFTARAFLADKLSLEQAEGVAAVIAAENGDQLNAARELMEGRSGEQYHAWGEELMTLLALVEAGIDFTDQEDVVAIPAGELRRRIAELEREIHHYLGAAAGEEVRTGLARVVLAGRPNAGKSTLFNALLGRRRAVVADAAGTTRDVLEELLDLCHELPGAGPVMLVDLAGLDEAAEGIDADAQRRAREAVRHADVVVHCDPAGKFADVEGVPPGAIRVRTKADLPLAVSGTGFISVCALDGWNLPILRRMIADAAMGSKSSAAAFVLPRHRRALGAVQQALVEARGALGQDVRQVSEPELVAGALRGALDAMGELIGAISPDDVIGRIFATFCIGK